MQLIQSIRRSELPTRYWNGSFGTLEDFLNSFFNPVPTPASENWVPAVDVLERDGNLVIRVETPGVNEKDIELKLEGRVLTLKGEKKMDKEETRGDYHRVERCHGTFSRSFTLPEKADPEKIRAEYRNGVLTVTVPQSPEAKPREIPVNVM
jgi:HSP20 family protein